MEEDVKPIIVTGVDVSKCEFLTKTGHCRAHMSIMGIDTNKCECFPKCYFKQLARKTQECEIWKNQVLTLDGEDVTVQITQEQFKEYNNLKAAKEQAEQKLEKIKRSECPYGGIDCAWCGEDCE